MIRTDFSFNASKKTILQKKSWKGCLVLSSLKVLRYLQKMVRHLHMLKLYIARDGVFLGLTTSNLLPMFPLNQKHINLTIKY